MHKRGQHNQTVTDEKGRRRFHGAFTGGYSAGYYNSVGSAEGWQPKTFVSSRKERNQLPEQKIEDFMDDEDDPLLGHTLETAQNFTQNPSLQKSIPSHKSKVHQPIPQFTLPDELILPASTSMGKTILQNMGWKEGQAIGPHLRMRKLSKFQTIQYNGEDEIYVPQRNVLSTKDYPEPKTDYYGAGFDPYNNAPEFAKYKTAKYIDNQSQCTHRKVIPFASAITQNRSSINRNSNIDDDDIFANPSMDDFDFEIAPTNAQKRLTGRQENDSEEIGRKSNFRLISSDGSKALPGFHIGDIDYRGDDGGKRIIERLQVPQNFKANHYFEQNDTPELYRKFNFNVRIASVQPNKSDGNSNSYISHSANTEEHRQSTLKLKTEEAKFRANIAASIAKRFVSADDGKSNEVLKKVDIAQRKSHRVESSWAPTSLLCKRFEVSNYNAVRNGNATDVAQGGLFAQELAPQLVKFAAERNKLNASENKLGNDNTNMLTHKYKRRSRWDQEATVADRISEQSPTSLVASITDKNQADNVQVTSSMIPLVKPPNSLLKAIFEPSDDEDEELNYNSTPMTEAASDTTPSYHTLLFKSRDKKRKLESFEPLNTDILEHQVDSFAPDSPKSSQKISRTANEILELQIENHEAKVQKKEKKKLKMEKWHKKEKRKKTSKEVK